MNNKKNITHLLIVSFLLLTFLCPTVIKAWHVFDVNSSKEKDHLHHNDCHSNKEHKSCYVCDFAFYAFKKSDEIIISSQFIYKDKEKEIKIKEKEIFIPLSFMHLRAPPCAA